MVVLTLEHDLAGSSNDVLYSFSYNGANQITSAEASNSAYEYQPLAMTASEYDPDGLNRYVTITADGSPVAITYDANQNLTGDGVWTYGYDVENRLISASGPGIPATYEYDPLGRRSRKSGTGLATEIYLSDGIEEIADYNGSGVLQRRYVRGPGVDEPLLMYVGAGTANKQYYHADWHRSVMAMSDASGALSDRYTYSAYGEVDDPTGNPMRYTGRRLDAETGLYYYRARYYNPALGRFLQTDPAGYAEGPHVYSYVRNDPLNGTDPTGQFCESSVSCALSRDERDLLAGRMSRSEYTTNIRARGVGGLIGAGGVLLGAGVYYGAAGLVANPYTFNQAGIAALEIGAGDALGTASLSAGASTTLYRVVDDVELDDILAHIKFKPSPNGAMIKQFLSNIADAKALRDAFERFWKQPQHIVEARAPESVMNAAGTTRFSDVPGRPMKSVDVPNEKLDEIEVVGALCTGTRVTPSGC